MSKKYNLKFGAMSILLTLGLNIGTLAMSPINESRVSESISGLKFKDKKPITRVGNGTHIKNGRGITDDRLSNCIKILAKTIQRPQLHTHTRPHTYALAARWIKHLYQMVITDYNCPPYDFIEKIKSIPKSVDQSAEEKHCPYCNEIIGDNKYCTDKDCISYWNLMSPGFKSTPNSLGNKTGWRERLCLLPAILLEMCQDTTIKFYPPAKAWAVRQLMEGQKIDWEYVDELFSGLSYSITRIPKIKELLNSAYESITIDDVIDASLYYENFQ